MDIENEGQGLNLSIQVLDGIMCHNGEILSNQYVPEVKDKDEFLREYHEAYTNLEDVSHHRAMTLEGCVVRISDIIGYIGRERIFLLLLLLFWEIIIEILLIQLLRILLVIVILCLILS